MLRALVTVPGAVRCDDLSRHPTAKHGIPATASLVSADGFLAQIDYRTRTPTFVMERLTRASCFAEIMLDRREHTFHADASVPDRMQSRNSDYSRTGYDRGHMAPAADHRSSSAAMGSTFTLANIAPQKAAFNRKYWARIEGFCRDLVKSRFEEVFVVTGSLFLPEKEEGEGGKEDWHAKYRVLGQAPRLVHVPTHFYKVVLIEEYPGNFVIMALVVPNEEIAADTPMTRFLVPLESLEESAGIIFFPKLLDDKARTSVRFAEYHWLAKPSATPALGTMASTHPELNLERCQFSHLCDRISCQLPPPFTFKNN